MDHITPRDREFVVDPESGRSTSESPNPIPGAKLAKTFFTKVCSGFMRVDGLVSGENGVCVIGAVPKSSDDPLENVKLLIDKQMEGDEAADLADKKIVNQKRKNTSAKKPPRPPRGPSLDSTDQKLIKEIAELIMMKRAKIERMKALKKMKAAKASSANGNLFATLCTVIFCLVMFIQGMSSSPITFRSAPKSARTTEGGFIFVPNSWYSLASHTNIPGFRSNLAEQVSGSEPEGQVSRAA